MPKSFTVTLIALAIGLCFTAAVAVAQSLPANGQTLYLDSYERRNDGAAGPVGTRGVLEAGRTYVVTVKGTFASVPRGTPLCGRSERKPQRRSKRRPSAPATADAEIVFGQSAHRDPDCSEADVPYHSFAFQMDLGQGFDHPAPVGGHRRRANRRHTYSYVVQGLGQRARFQLNDGYTRDNSGVLTIKVRPARGQ